MYEFLLMVKKQNLLQTFLKINILHTWFVPLLFKCQPHEMVKHTQTIRRLKPTNCLSVFNHFVVLALKELKLKSPAF